MFISIRFMKGMVNKCRAVCFIASKWEEGIGGNIFYEKIRSRGEKIPFPWK